MTRVISLLHRATAAVGGVATHLGAEQRPGFDERPERDRWTIV